MIDYRNNPEESPLVWCLNSQQLVHAQKNHVKMKTVFAVTPSGIYPYATLQLSSETPSPSYIVGSRVTLEPTGPKEYVGAD